MTNPVSDREQLALLVEQWNENRLDLFNLSYPTEDLEIEGVMRFYYQDGGRVLTKCVRVSSTATTRAVVDALAEKFLPDLKMLTDDEYSLWESHENNGERRLDDEEKPLLVQLNWHRDDREGRFVLRRTKQQAIPITAFTAEEENGKTVQHYAKKEKKEKKKHRDIVIVNSGREEAIEMSHIYQQLPQNTFTRTISNPEVVMKRKREQKVDSKLKEIAYAEGGSLKVYGGGLVPSRPYITLLVTNADSAHKILAEAVDKYGLDSSHTDFVLVEVPVEEGNGNSAESEARIFHPDECPLQVLSSRREHSYLALKRAPPDYRVPATVLQEPYSQVQAGTYLPSHSVNPAFVVLQPEGVSYDPPQLLVIRPGVTEIGSDKALEEYSQQTQNIYIEDPNVCGRHCVITYMEGVVTITPSASNAALYVNNNRIGQTEILKNGDVVIIGRTSAFIFVTDKNAPITSIQTQNLDYQQTTNGILSASLSGSSMTSRSASEHVEPSSGSLPRTSTTISLPISLQIVDTKVWDYLVEVMSRGYSDASVFRLSPAYAIYLALRFFQQHSKPYFIQFFTRISHHLQQISQECTSRDELIFWLANASELTYLAEKNSERTPRNGQLNTVVESVFRRLCVVLMGSIRPACQQMMETRLSIEEATSQLISLLDSTLRAAHQCRLVAGLTIQLSSQMFHQINSVIFNSLVTTGPTAPALTTRLGRCLLQRLTELHHWAEQMGVELSAECHLDRCKQAAVLLATQKNDVAALGATCYKLNSVQVHYLLSRFHVENGEIPCDDDVLTRIVHLAERQADQLAQDDGVAVTLEESDRLNLPFLVPQDGYIAEQMKTAPEGLVQYLTALQNKGLCHSVAMQDSSTQRLQSRQPSGEMAVYNRRFQQSSGSNGTVNSTARVVPMQRSASQTTLTSIPTQFGDSFGSSSTRDEMIRVSLKRGGGGIGLSIVAAQGVGEDNMGIYVKKVVDGSPAFKDCRLATGDQLISVNGHSLIGISQEMAAQYMSRAGAEVHFEVIKGAANRNGILQWLTETTPTSAAPPVQRQFAPSPAISQMSQSLHSQMQNNRPNGPPSYSNYAPLTKYGSQQSVQPSSSYQQRPVTASRGSAFAPPAQATAAPEPQRHLRSISASDLYNNDPNTSFSQRSITSTTGGAGGFDRLPAHYRQSARPTVIQPGRPGPSPASLRRGAQSPSSIYRPPSVNGLYRPPSVNELFAPPPKSPSIMEQMGYSSRALRASNQDLHRASTQNSPPHAQSSPLGDYIPANYSASLPAPIRPSNYSNMSNYAPIASFSSTTSSTAGPSSSQYRYSQMNESNQPDPVVVRPNQLGYGRDEREPARTTTAASAPVKGGMPTAITQALAIQAANAQGVPSRVVRPSSRPNMYADVEQDVMQLERSSNALTSYENMNDELDRLDAKGNNMTAEEIKRYRELLNAMAERRTSRTQEQPTTSTADTRKETLIDDVEPSSAKISARENISPPSQYSQNTYRTEKKSVQFKEDLLQSPDDYPDSPCIVGTNEIYRDPRQRRLEQQERHSAGQGPDGSKLQFQDKMKLFAKQIGENTPKQKYSSSSAERQILGDK